MTVSTASTTRIPTRPRRTGEADALLMILFGVLMALVWIVLYGIAGWYSLHGNAGMAYLFERISVAPFTGLFYYAWVLMRE